MRGSAAPDQAKIPQQRAQAGNLLNLPVKAAFRQSKGAR